MTDEDFLELRREVMRRMGQMKTEKKAASSRENGKKGGRPPRKEKID